MIRRRLASWLIAIANRLDSPANRIQREADERIAVGKAISAELQRTTSLATRAKVRALG